MDAFPVPTPPPVAVEPPPGAGNPRVSPPLPPIADEPPSSDDDNLKAEEEHAKTIGKSIARRFIVTSLPRNVPDPSQILFPQKYHEHGLLTQRLLARFSDAGRKVGRRVPDGEAPAAAGTSRGFFIRPPCYENIAYSSSSDGGDLFASSPATRAANSAKKAEDEPTAA